jgi:hypothetical protein
MEKKEIDVRQLCFGCNRRINGEPFRYNALSGMTYPMCGQCHRDLCNGCKQCERSD